MAKKAMARAASWRRVFVASALALCLSLVLLQAVLFSTGVYSRERLAEAAIELPVMLKFHKTGGTTTAATLARCVYANDREYGRWRDRLQRNMMWRPIKAACGNYDGHWGLNMYRAFGASGIKLCAGIFPQRANTKLVALLRNPIERFVSRLYYELGGRSELLLAPPFSQPVASWTPYDLESMEAIVCEACTTINGGHCHWRGGLCDTPQEYLAVFSRLGVWGVKSGELQSPPAATSISVSLPAAQTRLDKALRTALHNVRTDFDVIGVLEELHTFYAALSHELQWPLDSLLYSSRKVHGSTRRSSRNAHCDRSTSRRMSSSRKREKERRKKKSNALLAAKHHSVVGWSGVFPLLGWNNRSAPKTFRNDTLAYITQRNSQDLEIWTSARDAARAQAPPELVRRFDAWQTAYRLGIVPNALGFFSFCDWRPDTDNTYCQACAETQATTKCDVHAQDDVVLPDLDCRTASTEEGVQAAADIRIIYHDAAVRIDTTPPITIPGGTNHTTQPIGPS